MQSPASHTPPATSVEQEICDLYQGDGPGMFRYALTVAQTREAAQDAVQEAFFKFFVARSAGQQIRSPKAWLFRVVRNHALDQMRAGMHDQAGLESVMDRPGFAHDPELHFSAPEFVEKTLSPREGECVQLRAQGLRYDEIAAALQLRSGTVGALLTRAHKKIRAAMAAAGPQRGNLGMAVSKGRSYAS